MTNSSWLVDAGWYTDEQANCWGQYGYVDDANFTRHQWPLDSGFGVPCQVSSARSTSFTLDSFPPRTVDEPHPSFGSGSTYTEEQAGTATEFHFNDDMTAPLDGSTERWEGIMTSEYHLLLGSKQIEQQLLLSPVEDQSHADCVYDEESTHLSQSASPSGQSYGAVYANLDVSPSVQSFSSELIKAPLPKLAAAGYEVRCPYGCGGEMKGVYADGNLKRHQKSCRASGRATTRYHCVVVGCTRVYVRSDALRVHMRRYHGAPLVNHRIKRS
ncbi:hypothetical protein NX059_012310 [Plenodomus lindquistii]|nr:hypothetical protein NX059_012310 [Plenodomus lindquistii]